MKITQTEIEEVSSILRELQRIDIAKKLASNLGFVQSVELILSFKDESGKIKRMSVMQKPNDVLVQDAVKILLERSAAHATITPSAREKFDRVYKRLEEHKQAVIDAT